MVIIYMVLVVSMYILLFPNVVQDCSFKEFFIFQNHFFNPKYFYEMAFCCIIGITSYNNPVLYKLNAFLKNNTLWYIWK